MSRKKRPKKKKKIKQKTTVGNLFKDPHTPLLQVQVVLIYFKAFVRMG